MSIVIPAYNHEAYVQQAIYSALGQTYPNIEVIVVDDGSTDRTWDVIQAHAAALNDPRLKIFRKENGGPASANNFAVERSRGEFLAFLASDDFFVPDKIKRAVAMFEGPPPSIGLVHSSAFALYDDGRTVPMHGQYPPASGVDLEAVLSLRAMAVAIVVRREAYERVGGFDPANGAEDIDFFAALAAAGYAFCYDPEPLMFKRAGDTNLGAHTERCLRGHLATLAKHRASFSERQHARIEARLYRRMGKAAALEGNPALSWRLYKKLARQRRSPVPLVEWGAMVARRLISRSIPPVARHWARRLRWRLGRLG